MRRCSVGLILSTGCCAAPFIEPDAALQRPADFEGVLRALNLSVISGHRADLGAYHGKSHAFDKLMEGIAVRTGYEDQSSAAYYFDIFQRVHLNKHAIGRVVELGVFQGGTTQIFAGIAEHSPKLELHLIDNNARNLRCAHERARRNFPSAAARIRLFNGTLPEYVRDVLLTEHSPASLFVHHDASHDFNQVVRDLASLYFVGERLHSVGVQDTHLRSHPRKPNFVDLAVRAVFGADMVAEPIGAAYSKDNALMMNPNQWDGEYFLPGVHEGIFLLMSQNSFAYPHVRHSIDDFVR